MLRVLRDGDKLTGEPCTQPRCLGYCHECGCMRRVNSRWTTIRDEGATLTICERHSEPEEEPHP